MQVEAGREVAERNANSRVIAERNTAAVAVDAAEREIDFDKHFAEGTEAVVQAVYVEKVV